MRKYLPSLLAMTLSVGGIGVFSSAALAQGLPFMAHGHRSASQEHRAPMTADQTKLQLQALVTSGKLTQAQADKRLERMSNPPKHGSMIFKMRAHGIGHRQQPAPQTP